ncbi:hypothetical protein K449DRAFT_393671 [Hypoxylon sp. EC38]|nr:hypothetical protein K449DRAFT_393671 [Hypoxylon sp. EC38]
MRKASTGHASVRGKGLEGAEEAEQSKVDTQSSSTKTQPRAKNISSRISSGVKYMMGKDRKNESSPHVGEWKSPILSDKPIVPPKREFYESIERNASAEKKVVGKETYVWGGSSPQNDPSHWEDSSNWKVIDGDSHWAAPPQPGKKPYHFTEPSRVYGPDAHSEEDEAGVFTPDHSSKWSRHAPTREKTSEHQKQEEEEEALIADAQRFPQYEREGCNYQPNNDFGSFTSVFDMPDPRHVSREQLEASTYAWQVKQEKEEKKDREKQRERERLTYGFSSPSYQPFQALNHPRSETDASDKNSWPYGEHTGSYTKPRGIPRSYVCADLHKVREEAKKKQAAEEEKRRSDRQKLEKRIEQSRREKDGHKKSYTEASDVPSLEELRRRQAAATKSNFWIPQNEEEDEDQHITQPCFDARETAHSQKPKRQQMPGGWKDDEEMSQEEEDEGYWGGVHATPRVDVGRDEWSYPTSSKYRWGSHSQQEHQDPHPQDFPYSEAKKGTSSDDEDGGSMWSTGGYEIPEFPKPPSHRGLPHSMASMNMGPAEKAKCREELKKLSKKSASRPSQVRHASSEWHNEELKKHVADYGPISPLDSGFDKSLWPAPLNIRKKTSAPAKDVEPEIKNVQSAIKGVQLAVEKDVQEAIKKGCEQAFKKEEEELALKKEEAPVAQASRLSRSATRNIAFTYTETTVPGNTSEGDMSAPATVEDVRKIEEIVCQLGEHVDKFCSRVSRQIDALQARLDDLMREVGVDPEEED